jgi:hypothetical protein
LEKSVQNEQSNIKSGHIYFFVKKKLIIKYRKRNLIKHDKHQQYVLIQLVVVQVMQYLYQSILM